MYPISNALKEAFESNAKQYARITVGNTVIDNSRVRLGSFSVNRYALAEDTVVFGSCVAAEFNVTLENGDGAFSTGTFLGQEAFVEVGCDINGTVQYVPHGYFKFDMVTAQASALKLSALDRMMKFEKNVTTPYAISGTVSSLIDTVCTACGVTRGTFTLPVNGTVTLSGEVSDVKTYRDVLRWIGEVTGTIAYIGYDGKLYFGWYSGTEDFSVDPTNRAQGSISDDATTITSVSIVQGENMVTAGTGAKIVIRDNALIPLASATAQTIANNLYNHVNGFTYRTFEAGVHPMPHIAPLDCGVYSDLDGNDFDVCCTDWTFTLNANTKIAGKGGKQAYGRGYTLDESVFTARNIAAGAVTAEKIDVEDLAALRATIAGWKIATDALYKDVTINGTTYRVSLNAPASPSLTTPAFSVKKRTSSSDPWEEVADILYSGKVISKDFEATGSVKIQPDYDMQAAGVYAIDLAQNGAELYANPNFLNIEEGGSQTHLDATVISSTAADDTMLRMENYGADYAEFRATQGTYGASSYREGALSPKGVRFSKTDSTATAHMNADEVEVGNSKVEDGSFTSDDGTHRASMWTNGAGGFFEVYDQNTGKSSMLSLSELTVNDRDILRTHQSLVGGYGTQISANKNLNTIEFLSVGRYYCPMNVTVATLSNCPTSNAFMMDVFSPLSATIDDESASGARYRVRVLMTFYGGIYVQYAHASGTGANWTYGAWTYLLTSTTSEENSAYWLKAMNGRQSSLDNLTRTYAGSRVHMRLDIVSSSVSSSPFDGDGFLLTFFWDSDGLWDTQVFFPNGGGTPAIRKRRNNTAWEAAVKFVTTAVEKNSYSNTAVKNGALIARRQGNVVYLNSPNDAVSVPANTWTTYVTIGERYRPTEEVLVPVANTQASRWIRVSTNGKVELYTGSAITSAQNYGFCVTYIVD